MPLSSPSSITGVLHVACWLSSMYAVCPMFHPCSCQFINTAEEITTVLYIFEMLAHWIVMGLVIHPGSYLRSGWNVLEFLIIIVSIIGLLVPRTKFLVGMRALRPLRLLSRLPSAQLVVLALLNSFRNMINVLVLSSLLFFTFAVIAVAFFKGKLARCIEIPRRGDDQSWRADTLPYDQIACALNGGEW